MNAAATDDRSVEETFSGTSLLVLGMHRSGTSAITGALSLCGAWTGDEADLTDANVENPHGFWERRDIRRICDRLLRAAGADWWKVANFDPASIPHAMLVEQRNEFARVVSRLNEHGTWIVKEPRLCLLLPMLRDYLTNPVCIHIVRNPLEAARSLQTRNGFGIAGGLALWEVYNRRALRATQDLPRIMVCHESLMLHPVETLDELLERLDGLGVRNLTRPDEVDVKRFISPGLYRVRATENETLEYLTSSQRALWYQLRGKRIGESSVACSDARVTRQHLFDLESTESSLQYQKEKVTRLNAELRNRDKKIRERDAEIRRWENRTIELSRVHERKVRRLEHHANEINAEIARLLGSRSWKATAPLRAVSRAARRFGSGMRGWRNGRYWMHPGRTHRATEAVRSELRSRAESAANHDQSDKDGNQSRVSRLIAECRSKRERETGAIHGGRSVGETNRTSVSVIAWDLGHNPLGRAYLLADALRNEYDVELIGATFPRFGNQVWEPFRTGSRVTIKSFPGGNFPQHFRYMEDVAEQIEGDVIFVSKPRLPSLELAILAKLHRNRPIVLDIDDYELGFFENRQPLTLGEIKTAPRNFDTVCPHDETWTRYSESLIPLCEQITVSNEELRKKFGGIVLPHIRDADDFEPSIYPRDEIRAGLGFSQEDRVILFAGTPRVHKGYEKVIAALTELNRDDYKFLLIGAPADWASRRAIGKLKNASAVTLPNVPFRDLPGYLCAGDLICLLQDDRIVTSHFQMPAKFTDGLAMGIPMLASNVPPLINLAEEGLVELLHDMSLHRKIHQIFENYDIHKRNAVRNRQIFQERYSYESVVPRIKDLIERLRDNATPFPEEFRDLVAYHRKLYGDSANHPSVTPTVVSPEPKTHDWCSCDEEKPTKSNAVRSVENRSCVDDKLDIVFFWKQNDTGIYGRRQDMIVKYLARHSRIHRIFHFDAPFGIFHSGKEATRTGLSSRHSHAWLVLANTLRRKYFRGRWKKTRYDTYAYVLGSRAPWVAKWLLPSEDGYLDFLDRIFRRYNVGERRVVFWVCPNNFDFPSIERRFRPDLVVADIIDDQRKWNIAPQYEERLHRNYRDILKRSHLAFANCESVLKSMREFSENIHLIPNGAEVLEHESRSWTKPAELKRLNGPIVGYVGNLDVTRIDVNLLANVARARPDWNFIFIGSMHKGTKIMRLNQYKNVRFLGVRIYREAIQFIRFFDVAIIPHLDNALTRNMNPLKLYVYFSLHVPVVATPIANMDDFREFVRVGRTADEFLDQIQYCIDENPISKTRDRLGEAIRNNSWTERVDRVVKLIEREIGIAEEPYG